MNRTFGFRESITLLENESKVFALMITQIVPPSRSQSEELQKENLSREIFQMRNFRKRYGLNTINWLILNLACKHKHVFIDGIHFLYY